MPKKNLRRILTNVSVLNDKGTILKKINVSSIVQFCLGKYGFCLDIFLIYLIVWGFFLFSKVKSRIQSKILEREGH